MRYLWLTIPSLLALWAPLYNRIDPEFFGVPLFYWLQMLLIPVSAIGIYLADREMRR